MRGRWRFGTAALVVLAAAAPAASPAPPASAAPAGSPAPTPAAIVAAAPAGAWRAVAPENLLLMQLGDGRRVAIELAPEFAPVHVASIRALARSGWWDKASIVRVQDGYVVQWSGADEKKTPLPAGVAAHPPAEYERASAGLSMRSLAMPDAYASQVGFVDGWPVGSDGARSWLAHCYGMVGVGRDMPPDTGDATELYAVIGQAPRQLDRNIALVGRVVDGMAVLASLPRGTADLGFYATPEQRVAIRSVRVAVDLPAPERPSYEVMRTDGPLFARYLDARANRRDAFYVRPAAGVDLCNAPVPVRAAP